MLDPSELYDVAPEGARLDNPILIQALDGFIDAGAVRHLVRTHLLDSLPHRVVATFDVDALLDYRARRPYMTFQRDHWAEYDEPVLALYAVTDAAGTEFLLLSGPEPDSQWERFTAAVVQLVEQFRVRLTIGISAIPMAVPHTRGVSMTTHGTRPDIVPPSRQWIDTVQVPASAGALLEYRLGQAGHDAISFAVHVPHYVSQMQFAPAALSVLESIANVSKLDLAGDALREAAEATMALVDSQVADSPDVAAAVHALEEQYDAFVRGQGKGLLAEGATQLPTADEIGAELERFLAQQSRGPGPSEDE
jgi:hypothetical protein